MKNPFKKPTPYQQFLEDNPQYVGFGKERGEVWRKSDGTLMGWFNPLPTGWYPNVSSGIQHPSAVNGPDWWRMK